MLSHIRDFARDLKYVKLCIVEVKKIHNCTRANYLNIALYRGSILTNVGNENVCSSVNLLLYNENNILHVEYHVNVTSHVPSALVVLFGW